MSTPRPAAQSPQQMAPRFPTVGAFLCLILAICHEFVAIYVRVTQFSERIVKLRPPGRLYLSTAITGYLDHLSRPQGLYRGPAGYKTIQDVHQAAGSARRTVA